MTERLCGFCVEESGQDLVEYSLLITFVALACAAFLGAGNPAISGIWQVNNDNLVQANNAAFGH